MDNKININGNSKQIIKDVLFQETCELNLNSARFLGVSATSKVVSVETLDGEIKLGVKTVFSVLTCTENGEFATVFGESESVKTINGKDVFPTTKARFNACVTECEISSSNPFRVKATVEISGWYVNNAQITLIDVNCEDIYCKSEKMTVESVIPLSCENVTLSYTDETRMPVAKILDYCGNVTLSSVYPASGTYRVDGDLNLRVVALTDNGQFITQNFSHPFNAECVDENVTSNMRLDVEGKIKSLDFTVTESDKRILVSDAVISICGVAMEESEVERATDAYSTKYETQLVAETKRINTHFCMRSVREKATSSVKVDEISEILAVTSPCVSVSGTSDDGLGAEGIISAYLAYLDDDGKPRQTRVEIPFISSLGGDFPCETTFNPEVAVTSISAKLRGTNDVEITAELLVTLRGIQTKEITVISDVVFGAEKEDDDFAISLYIAKDKENLFDVAKSLNVDEETLLSQNPDLVLPLKGGEKIILYKQLSE